MKKCVVLIAVTMLLVNVCKSQTWVYRTAFPGDFGDSRRGKTAVAVGTKVYMGLGLAGNTFYKDWWEFNTLTNTWIQLADLPGGTRYDAVSFVIGSTIYVGGGDTSVKASYGNTGTYLSDFYAFNTQTNTWTTRASSPDPCGEAAAFSIGGKGYVTCGRTNSSISYSFRTWCYDATTNSWSAKPNFPGSHARAYPIAFSINGKGYVGGGMQGAWGVTAPATYPDYYGDFYEYTPTADIWTRKADVPNISTDGTAPMSNNAVASYCDRGYIIGGSADHTVTSSGLKTVYEYQPNSDSWTQRPDFPIEILGGQAWIINGTLYGCGGSILARQSHKIWSFDLQNLTVPAEICTSTPISFQNGTSSTSISWVSSIPNGISVSPSTGTTVNLSKVGGYNNAANITATMTGPNGCLVTRTTSAWAGPPVITNWSIDGYPSSDAIVCPGGHNLKVTPSGRNASTATWIVPPGYQTSISGNQLGINLPPYMPSSISIKAYSTNGCGPGTQLTFTLIKKTTGCPGMFMVTAFPNPAQESLSIELKPIDPQSEFGTEQPVIDEAILLDENENVVRTSSKAATSITFNVRELKKGQYHLRARVGKEFILTHVLIE